MKGSVLLRELRAYVGDIRFKNAADFAYRRDAASYADMALEWANHGDSNTRDVVQAALRLKESAGRINAGVVDEFRQTYLASANSPGRDHIRRALDRFTGNRKTNGGAFHYGHDSLDLFLDELLRIDLQYASTPGDYAVHYEPAPAAVVLDMIDNVSFKKSDVFYDVGSGLGRVCILIRLLTDTGCVKGLEINGDLWNVALQVTDAVGLADIEYINADARDADLSDGTLFFLFTPFTGHVMDTVIHRLERVAGAHGIIVCSFGGSSARLGEEPWLHCIDPDRLDPYKVSIFQSGLEGIEPDSRAAMASR